MPTTSKKKEKSKGGSDLLQCSVCGRILSQTDSEAHTASASCSESNHAYIFEKVLNGKLVSVEKTQTEDGTPAVKSVKDYNNTVWMSVPAMQMCGLSIGQPCVVNRVLVRTAWPAKMSSSTAVALTSSSIDLLSTSIGNIVTVERLHQSKDIAKSLTIMIGESNKMFESEDFCKFTAAYLDGKFITEGTPLQINYFGQVCRCHVHGFASQRATLDFFHHSLNANTSPCQAPAGASDACPSTPTREPKSLCNSSFNTSVYSTPSDRLSPPRPDASVPKTSISTTDDLSESFSSLDISNVSQNCMASPDVSFQRHLFPNLVTPVKDSDNAGSFKPKHKPFVSVEAKTCIFVMPPKDLESLEDLRQADSLDSLGGLSAQIEELKSRIKRGLQPSSSSRCILLYGPPGVGKTLLAKALTADLGLHTTYVSGTDVWSKLFGEAESNLKKLFKAATERSPSILVIDDIDVLCPRTTQSGQQVQRIVGTLLSLLDSCSSDKTHPVAILAITNNKDGMNASLLRAGRFGCEVEVSVPTAQQRLQILRVLLSKVPHRLTEEDLVTVGKNAHGYVGADLAALINEACMHAYSADSSAPPTLTMEDFAYAGLQVKPSALREIQLDIPQVRWSDIGGMSEVKMRLREAVELPLSRPEVYKGLGIEPPRGLLMYGPPGCSKTMVARALATECHLNFLAVKGPELFNQYVGESEKAIREVFRKARSAAPSVIFFDEIDAIAAKRGGSSGVDDRVLTQLLTEMDGMETLKDVFVMAATNRPDKMDKALLRPGRFDSLVYVPLPDEGTRKEILQGKFAKMSVSPDVDLATLVQQTHNYSGAEVIQVCQEAALFALREDLTARDVHRKHFDLALVKVQPQIDTDLLQLYAQFSKTKS